MDQNQQEKQSGFLTRFYRKVFSFTKGNIRNHIYEVLGPDEFQTINLFVERHFIFFFVHSFVPFLIKGVLGGLLIVYFYKFRPYLEGEGVLKDGNFFAYLEGGLFLLMGIFLVMSLKNLYNTYVDYKNDFLVSYGSGIYISDKNGVLHQSSTRIPFANVQSINSTQKHFGQIIFDYGTIYIRTVKDVDDIEFKFAKKVNEQVGLLQDSHLGYIERNNLARILKEQNEQGRVDNA